MGSHHRLPNPSPSRPRGSGIPQETERANIHLCLRGSSGSRPAAGGAGGGAGGPSGAPGSEEGGPCPVLPQPPCFVLTDPALPGPTVSSLRALLPLAENLKANPPGSLPVLGGTSETPAQAGLRPGSEDAGRRARAGRRLGGVDGGGAGPTVWGGAGGADGARLRSPAPQPPERSGQRRVVMTQIRVTLSCSSICFSQCFLTFPPT